MTSYEIPLTGQSQKLNINFGASNYWLTVIWNAISACWNLDIADTNQVPIVQGIPLVTGLDLLAQFRYIGIKGSLVVQTDNSADVMPTYGNLGTDSHLYFVVS